MVSGPFRWKLEASSNSAGSPISAVWIAVQLLNNEPEQTIFGIVSNGAMWQFGKLKLEMFTQNKIFYTIQDLERLFAAVNYVFKQCELQL